MRSEPNCELSPSIRTTRWQRYFLLGTRLNATGDVDSARRPLDNFPELIKNVPGGAAGPRGVIGAGDISAVIGWPVYLDVIERRFTNAFQAVEKEVVNDDRAHLQQLAGRVAIRVLAGEPEAAKSVGEEALPLLEARLRERPDDTFAMTGLSWVYLALDAMPMRCAFLDKRRIQSPSKRMLWPVQFSRSGSRKSRHVRAHLRKPLRGFDVCSPSRRAGQRPSLFED